MAVNNDILYINFSPKTEVRIPDVYFKDVAKFECTNKDIVNKLSAAKILHIQDGKHTRYIMTVLKAIEIIHEMYPNLEIVNLGVTEFIVAYEKNKHRFAAWNIIKTILVCIITFAGSAFSIMAFNNDVGVNDLFKQIYEWTTGEMPQGFTVLELTYSIGLLLGVVIFFNHIGGRKLSVDPTPMEVAMRKYEDDVDNALVESYGRKGDYVDVGDTAGSDTNRS